MDIIRNLYREIIVKYRNEQININLNSINNERDALNEKLLDLIQHDRHLINKYYSIQKGGNNGVNEGLTQENINKFTKLKEILDKINQINPVLVESKINEIKKKTDEIVQKIPDIREITDLPMLFDKIPQKLNVIQSRLVEGTQNQFDIANRLGSLYVPFDNIRIEQSKLINTTQLNKKLEEIKASYTALENSIKTSSPLNQTRFNTDITNLESTINGYILKLTAVKTELDGVNTQLELKNENFVKLSNFTLTRENLVFIIVEDEILKRKFDEYKINAYNEYTDKIIIDNMEKKLEEEINKKIAAQTLKSLPKRDKTINIEYITYYNEEIMKVKKHDNLPRKLYSGSDTKAISNNMIKNDAGAPISMMNSVGDLLKIKLDKEFDGTAIKKTGLDEIYNPNFTGGTKMIGGAATIDDIKRLMTDLDINAKNYMGTYKKYVHNTQKYNKFSIYEITHSVYLLSILSNALFVKGSYQVYKYIGRGMINFYKRIIEKIYKDLKRDIESFTPSEEQLKNLTQEIRKKYYLTILILRGFLERLAQLLTPVDIIDIDVCKPEILQYFTLLNHFKNILEKYNETQMNKLTIFSRVNDIGMSGDFRDEIMQTLDLPSYILDASNNQNGSQIYNKFKIDNDYKNRIDYNINNKLFLSDYLRRNIYAGYYIKNNDYANNVNLFDLSKNKLLNFELRKFIEESTLNIKDERIKEAYTYIKKVFDDPNLTSELKIEELEKYKKESLSVLLKSISEDIYTREGDINRLNNEINKLKTDIIDIKSTMEDTYDSVTIKKEAKPDFIKNIKDNQENLQKEQRDTTLERELSSKNPDEIMKTKKDIEQIRLVMRIALEYLYATSPYVNEKLMWLRNITCDAQKSEQCSAPQDNPYDGLTNDDNKPKSCKLENIPYLNSYKFTEVFDTQNFVNNSDMAAYMCLNTRLSGGNGVCLITYGYSGTGKSYTLFGAPGKDGLLQGTLSKLDGLEKVYFRTFEIYGKGLPYVDYWYEPDGQDGTKQKNKNIYNYLYAYKLKAEDPNTFVEGIRVEKPQTKSKYNKPEDEWAVELEGVQIDDYINKITVLRNKILNKESAADTSYTKDSNGDKDILDYMEISNTSYQQLFRNFSKFTDKIEEMRKRTQRVRETPNNKVSSRSILIYDFIVVINKDDKSIPVNLLIIDLPGREEIAPTFINKYVEKPKEKVEKVHLYNIIKEEFEKDYNNNNDYSGNHIDSNYSQLFKNNPNPGETYMKELKAMLCAFTLNPLCVPIFACEIIEKYIKDNYTKGKNLKTDIIERKLNIKYTLYGESNGVFNGNSVNIDAEFKLLDEFYYLNYSEKIFLDKPNYYETFQKSPGVSTPTPISYSEVDLHKYFVISDIYFNSKLGWYTFHNLLTITDDGNIVLNKNYDDKPLKAVLDWNTNFRSKINPTVVNKRSATRSATDLATPKSTYKIPYGNDSLELQNGRQIKILLFINLIKRIINLNRYDILNDLFQAIIDEKINKYIKNRIDKQTNQECQKIISQLIENNFKRDALKEKFYVKDSPNFLEINNNNNIETMQNILGDITLPDNKTTTQFQEKQKFTVNFKEYLYKAIKYDFYTTGFEGIYINENIIGLIKYLGKDGKNIVDLSGNKQSIYLIQNETDRNMIDIIKQKETNTFNKNIQISKLINVSKMEKEGKQNALDLDKNTLNIAEYGGRILDLLKPTGPAAPNALKAELAKRLGAKNENKATAGEAMNLPDFFRYDEKTKLKLFKLNTDDYFKQLFIKDELSAPINKDILDNEALRILPQSSGTGQSNVINVTTLPDWGKYYYNAEALDEFFQKTIKSYESKKIFCYDSPIIKTILNPYLDIIGDFKIFYLFGNYEKPMRELKCAQQYELLETTNNFIEAITR